MLDARGVEPLEGGAGAGDSATVRIVEAVLWACELSEDEMEVGDLVEVRLAGAPPTDEAPLDEPAQGARRHDA